MTITIIQTCKKCKKERQLTAQRRDHGQQIFNVLDRGWRQFDNKDVCSDCMREFVDTLK